MFNDTNVCPLQHVHLGALYSQENSQPLLCHTAASPTMVTRSVGRIEQTRATFVASYEYQCKTAP